MDPVVARVKHAIRKHHRRQFAIQRVFSAALLIFSAWTTPTHAQSTALVGVDPRTGIVHSQKLISGIPLGGIGAGKVDIRTDGSFGQSSAMNNWDRPTGNLPGCFAAIWSRVGTQTTARVLSLKSAYGLTPVAKLDFDGLTPQAQLSFLDPALPFSVKLLAFSPLTPFVIKDSSYPAAAFVFQLKNTLPIPVEVSVAISWEGLLGLGSDGKGHAVLDRTGVRAAAIPSAEGYFGLRLASPESADDGSDSSRQRANASGEMAIMAYPLRPEAAVTVAGWNALDARPGWWDGFSANGDVSGDVGAGIEGAIHPSGAVAVRLTLKPNEYVALPFAVSWYARHHWLSDGHDAGHFYQTLFDDAPQAARRLLADWDSLYALTEEWQKCITFSNLPRWLARRLINSVAPLVADSIYTQDGRFALLSRAPDTRDNPVQRLPSTVRAADATQRLAANAMLLALFPRLDTQYLQQYAAGMLADGASPPASVGDLPALLGPPAPVVVGRDTKAKGSPPVYSPTVKSYTLPASVAGNSSYVLEVAQYTLWTGDVAFLRGSIPAIRTALVAMTHACNSDGLPMLNEATPPSTASLTLYLASLKAGERLAELAGDPALEATCREAALRGVRGLEKDYWNGTGYGSAQSRSTEPRGDLDQLLGQWIAYQLDLGELLPAAHVATALLGVQARAGVGEPISPASWSESDTLAVTLAVVALTIRTDRAEAGIALLHSIAERQSNEISANKATPEHLPDHAGATLPTVESNLGGAADWNLIYGLAGFAYNAITSSLTVRPNIPGTWRTYSGPIFAPTFWGMVDYKPTAHGGLLNLRIDRLIFTVSADKSSKNEPVLANDEETLRRQNPANRSRKKEKATTPLPGLFALPELVLTSLKVPGPPASSLSESGRNRSAYVSVGQRPIGCSTVLDRSGQMTLTFDSPLHLSAGDRLQVDIH